MSKEKTTTRAAGSVGSIAGKTKAVPENVLDMVKSVEENLGIRQSSRFIPIVVTLMTVLSFLGAIHSQKTKQENVAKIYESEKNENIWKPIENERLLGKEPKDEGWIELRAKDLRFLDPDARDSKKVFVSGSVKNGEAIYVSDETRELWPLGVIYVKSNLPLDPKGEQVVVTYRFTREKSGDFGLTENSGFWTAPQKYWEADDAFRGLYKKLENISINWPQKTEDLSYLVNRAKFVITGVFALLTPLGVVAQYDLMKLAKFFGYSGFWIGFYSLFPGLAGMFYRRAFAKYFLASVFVLLLIEILFQQQGWGSIAMDKKEGLIGPFGIYLSLLGLIVLGIAFSRIRVHNLFDGFSDGVVAASKSLFAPATAIKIEDKPTGKNIVVCLDGSWNTPGQLEKGQLASTNVFKIFQLLKGKRLSIKSLLRLYDANIVKQYKGEGTHQQIGLYYNGVGNRLENSKFGVWFGGAFGMGAEAIKERAYLDIVKEYEPGDRIFIFGFSRGAAIARLVAGAIGRRGLPRSVVSVRLFGRMRPIMNLWGKYEDVKVDVLGCFDTVGAFGIGKDFLGIPFQKMNLLKDLTVGDHVKRAYHLVALDEVRDAFEPTLMNPDPLEPGRIVEVWFSGSHGNVGGGYAQDRLSDGALSFMLGHISSGYRHKDNGDKPMGDETWGIYLNATNVTDYPEAIEDESVEKWQKIRPALTQVRTVQGGIYELRPRKVPINAVIYDDVFDLIEGKMEKESESAYAPASLFQLSDDIISEKAKVKEKIHKLIGTFHGTASEGGGLLVKVAGEKMTRAGLKEGDVILEVDGGKVADQEDFLDLMKGSRNTGGKVKLTIRRGAAKRDLEMDPPREDDERQKTIDDLVNSKLTLRKWTGVKKVNEDFKYADKLKNPP